MKIPVSCRYAIVLCAFLLGLSGCVQPDPAPLPLPDEPVLSSEKVLTKFEFAAAANGLSAKASGTIDEAGKAVAVTLPYSATVAALTATFTVSAKATVKVAGVAQVSGTTARDFSSGVTYTVEAEDGTTVDYVVTATPTLALVSGAAADVVLGQPNFTSYSAPSVVSAASLFRPEGTAAVVGNKLFLPDTWENRILVYDTVPTTNEAAANYAIGAADLVTAGAGTLDATGISTPLAVASNGTTLAVADYDHKRLLLFATIPTTSGGTASIVVGQPDFVTATTGVTQNQVSSVIGVSLSGTKLLLVDHVNNRVLIWNTLPTANGQNADLVLGQANFLSSGTGVNATSFDWCSDVWTDGTRVIVSDRFNNRVLIWNTFPTVNGQAADVVVGQSDFTLKVAATSGGATGLNKPLNIASNGTMLAVTDSDNNRVLIWKTIPTTNGQAADIVLGQPDFDTVTYATTASKMESPAGVFLDKKRLIVLEPSNNRALIFKL